MKILGSINQRAFSLTEVLVGVAIAVVAIVAVGATLNAVNRMLAPARQFEFETTVEARIRAQLHWSTTRLGNSDRPACDTTTLPWAKGIKLVDSNNQVLFPTTTAAGLLLHRYDNRLIQASCVGPGRIQVRYRPAPWNAADAWTMLFQSMSISEKQKRFRMDNGMHDCFGSYKDSPYCDSTGQPPVTGIFPMMNTWGKIIPAASAVQFHNSPKTAKVICRQLGFNRVVYQEGPYYKKLVTTDPLEDYWSAVQQGSGRIIEDGTSSSINIGNIRRSRFNGNEDYYRYSPTPNHSLSDLFYYRVAVAPGADSVSRNLALWLGRLHCAK